MAGPGGRATRCTTHLDPGILHETAGCYDWAQWARAQVNGVRVTDGCEERCCCTPIPTPLPATGEA